jgi:RNA polymerase sporulation-specific sigma factor
LIEKLENVIKTCLSKREYQIISLRYGLNNTPSYTQREVAQKLGISRSYISRLEKKAVGIIKQKAKEKNIFFA